VVKPSRSVGEADGLRQKLGVRHAEDAARLREVIAALPQAAFPVLVQERIVGPGQGIFVLRWQARTIARFAHVRLREKPPSGGVSVLAESVPGDPELVQAAEALLAALDWEGVAMVEFKRDASTDRPYLMEINGRFWGSLQLAIDAGVDFPRLLVEATLGGVPRESLTWRSGLRSRWFWGDLDHLLIRLIRSGKVLDLPPGSPSRSGALLRFLGWRPWRERDAVFRLNDPMPFLRESAGWIRAL
jgi:predicted ATP-grasp superfamily ATP-dependent carboligase